MNNVLKSLSSIIFLITSVSPVWADHHKSNEELPNIVETAASVGTFNTLLTAAKAAGLVSALTTDGPLTVFAPTDDAFGNLPMGTIDNLLKKQNRELLARILSFHVVSGQIGSEALANNASLKTLAGASIEFTQTENGFSVEGARIISTDIKASNGIVHVIDRIMMPPKQISRSDAEQMVVVAIQQAVPMFNNGNHLATANIYSNTIKTLIDSAPLLGDERKRLSKALEKSRSEDPTKSAWMLRYALDDLIKSMKADLSAAHR